MSRRDRAFTLVELLVVVAIIALLIAILLPSLSRARDQARTTACLANLRSTSMMLHLYATDNDQNLPWSTAWSIAGGPASTAPAWHDVFRTEMNAPVKAMQCAASGPGNAIWTTTTPGVGVFTYTTDYTSPRKWYLTDFGLNSLYAPRNDQWQSAWPKYGNTKKLQNPMAVLAFVDASDRFTGGWAPGNGLIFRHSQNEAINLSFFDGHAETWAKSVCRTSPRQLFTSTYNVLPWKDF